MTNAVRRPALTAALALAAGMAATALTVPDAHVVERGWTAYTDDEVVVFGALDRIVVAPPGAVPVRGGVVPSTRPQR